MKFLSLLKAIGTNSVWGFSTSTFMSAMKNSVSPPSSLQMALKYGKRYILIGVTVNSGCGNSTFMKRHTSIFKEDVVGPLGAKYGDPGGWEIDILI